MESDKKLEGDYKYWVYNKVTGKIKGFDIWKDAVEYDKELTKQNNK